MLSELFNIAKIILFSLAMIGLMVVLLPIVILYVLISSIYDYVKKLINNPIKVIRKTLWIIIKLIVFFSISSFVFLIIAGNTAVAFSESYAWIAALLVILNPSIVILVLRRLFFKKHEDKAGLALAEGQLTVKSYNVQRAVRGYTELADEEPMYDDLLLVDIGDNCTLNLTSYLFEHSSFLPLRETIQIYYNRNDPQRVYGIQTFGLVINEQQIIWSDDYSLGTDIFLKESLDELLTNNSKNMDQI